MRRMLFSIVSLVIAVAWASAADKDADQDLKVLTGEWSAPYKYPVPSGLAPRLPEGNSYAWCQINADGTAKINGVDNEAEMTFNPGKKPKTVDIEYTGGPLKGKKQYGIYEIKKGKVKEHDSWILVVSDLETKETDRPKDLEKPQAKTTRYTFHRSYTTVIE